MTKLAILSRNKQNCIASSINYRLANNSPITIMMKQNIHYFILKYCATHKVVEQHRDSLEQSNVENNNINAINSHDTTLHTHYSPNNCLNAEHRRL